MLAYSTVDAVICAVERRTAVDRPTVFASLAAARGPAEFRVLPELGFGGKLWFDPSRRKRRFRVSFYPEDATVEIEQTAEQINAALAEVEVVSGKVGVAMSERSGAVHLPVGDGDDVFQPIACGRGISFNGGTRQAVVTCAGCRVGQVVGAELSQALFNFGDALAESMGFKTFPEKRRASAMSYLQWIDELSLSGDVRSVVWKCAAAGVPASTFGDVLSLSYVALFHRFVGRVVGVAEQLSAGSRFPNRAGYSKALAELNWELGAAKERARSGS